MIKIHKFLLVLIGVFLSSCGHQIETNTTQVEIPLLIQLQSASVTATPPTSMTFHVACNGGSAVSQTITIASNSSVIVQSGAVCTLDMTSFVTSGLTYSSSGSDLIVTVSSTGAVTSNASTAMSAASYVNGLQNVYFVVGSDLFQTPYTLAMDYDTQLSQILIITPASYSATLLPATPPTVSAAVYAFHTSPTASSSTLTVTVSGANDPIGDTLDCVVIQESAAPTSQSTAQTQFNNAYNAINSGVTASGSYGNSCATSNASDCKCPGAFNSTLINGAGNWDIFYSKSQVIIWVNGSLTLNSGYTVLLVPAAP